VSRPEDKVKAEAILAREELKKPKPGQRVDHDSPDVSHPDQRARGKSEEELARLPVPEPPD
jgi:hypothetical protein